MDKVVVMWCRGREKVARWVEGKEVEQRAERWDRDVGKGAEVGGG